MRRANPSFAKGGGLLHGVKGVEGLGFGVQGLGLLSCGVLVRVFKTFGLGHKD